MTENNHRKQFNLKLVLKEIIQPKVPTIALVIFLNFIFFLFGVFTFYSAIFFIIIFIGFFLALSNEKKISLDTTQNNINKKDKDELVTDNINQIKMIFDGFPESVILIDDKDNIINSNDKANKNFFSQLENENILGMRIQNVIRSTLLFDALELLKNNEDVTIKEIEIILPSEIERTYDVFISKVKLFSQDINSYLLILRETTDLKKIMTLRSEFIANASHELKTPIAVIKGISETLEKYGQDDKDSSKEFLKKLLSESNRAQSLIEDLLSLNQAEMRQHILPDKRINLISIIDNIYDGLNELAKKNKINLTRDIRKKNYYILGDEDDIRRTFINLIENAIKYNSSGKEVIIHLSDNSDKVLFKVIDDGPGISSIHIPRLTERFYRVDLDSSIKKGGTGLGLSIVKNIITRHKAQLDIDSELGKGSSFSIIFNKA